eukprot:14344631-Alexandrium_andersonii.AAC.1
MFRIWNCTDATSRPLGDHIGTDLERHRVWQANHDVEYMGARSLFYHDCLDFMARAAFDFEFQPSRSLGTDAENMLKYEPVRRPDGQARQLPQEYLPYNKWP